MAINGKMQTCCPGRIVRFSIASFLTYNSEFACTVENCPCLKQVGPHRLQCIQSVKLTSWKLFMKVRNESQRNRMKSLWWHEILQIPTWPDTPSSKVKKGLSPKYKHNWFQLIPNALMTSLVPNVNGCPWIVESLFNLGRFTKGSKVHFIFVRKWSFSFQNTRGHVCLKVSKRIVHFAYF